MKPEELLLEGEVPLDGALIEVRFRREEGTYQARISMTLNKRGYPTPRVDSLYQKENKDHPPRILSEKELKDKKNLLTGMLIGARHGSKSSSWRMIIQEGNAIWMEEVHPGARASLKIFL